MKHEMYWMPDEGERRNRRETFEKGLPEGVKSLANFESKDLDAYEKAIEGYKNLYIDNNAYDALGRKIPNYSRLVLTEPKADMTDFWKKLKTIKKDEL